MTTRGASRTVMPAPFGHHLRAVALFQVSIWPVMALAALSTHDTAQPTRAIAHASHQHLPMVRPSTMPWFKVEGPCTINPVQPWCIRSPNYPASYGSAEACIITPTDPVKLFTRSFDTDDPDGTCEHDFVAIGNRRFCGSLGPNVERQLASRSNGFQTLSVCGVAGRYVRKLWRQVQI